MNRLLRIREERLENDDESKKLVHCWHKVFREILELPNTLSYIESNLWAEIVNNKKYCFTVVELLKENQDLVKETMKVRHGFSDFLNK